MQSEVQKCEKEFQENVIDVFQKDLEKKNQFLMEIKMYSIWDGKTEDGWTYHTLQSKIEIPNNIQTKQQNNNTQLKKRRWTTKLEKEVSQFWNLMKYWNTKSKVKTIDRKQFLEDVGLIKPTYSCKYGKTYYINENLLEYTMKEKIAEILEKEYPVLFWIIIDIESYINSINKW